VRKSGRQLVPEKYKPRKAKESGKGNNKDKKKRLIIRRFIRWWSDKTLLLPLPLIDLMGSI